MIRIEENEALLDFFFSFSRDCRVLYETRLNQLLLSLRNNSRRQCQNALIIVIAK